MKRQALGKGLGALLGTLDSSAGERVNNVEVELIIPNQYQPRKHFSREKLEELAESLSSNGIIQPLVVRRADKKYELISGERRLQAAQIAGMKMVPVIIRSFDDRQMLVAALVENLQREDLNALEECNALDKLIEDFGLSHQEVGDMLGKSRTHISNVLRLRKLPTEIQQMISDSLLSFGHAKVLAGIKDHAALMDLANKVVEEGLSVRECEKLASEITSKSSVSRRTRKPKLSPHLRKLQQDLTTVLGTTVRIHKGKRKGKIEIQFNNTDELDSLLAKMLSP